MRNTPEPTHTPSAAQGIRIHNPVLPGFHPDPSILRVGADFFIATSTFEWFPGVRIFHSRDLVHWRLAACPLDSYAKIDLRRLEASCGVWAPCLTHDGERFHLVYSNVLSKTGPYWDVHNYLVTAPSVGGPWSDPVTLNQSGFDPSMFHDDDGSKWLLNMVQDPRPGQSRFGGIIAQQYCPRARRLIGKPNLIFSGSPLGVTEGPHLYKREGWYYLMTAEGGTSWRHAVTMARSRELMGPYTLDPCNPILTAWQQKDTPLHKAGHGALVDTPDGRWYLAHLCSRPLPGTNHCFLGRETALQEVIWNTDGWLRLRHGGRAPAATVEAPDLTPHPWPSPPESHDFDEPTLPLELQTLREAPHHSWLSLAERPGWLRLRGRMSLFSNAEQSLVGHRIAHFNCAAETLLDYSPENHLQSAGLCAFYDDQNWYYLAVGHDPARGCVLRLLANRDHKMAVEGTPVPLPRAPVHLRLLLRHGTFQAAWRNDPDTPWNNLGPPLDASPLSDDHGKRYRFTGAFFALCAQDHSGLATPADFDYLRYTPNTRSP